MKLERLNYNKLKIFLTFDDLYENGLAVEDIKGNCLKVHSIIQRMVESACDEINFPMKGAIEIEIYSLHAQGLVMIITRNEDTYYFDDEDELFDLQVFMEEQNQILYTFQNFEYLVQLCKILHRNKLATDSSIYSFNNQYYIQIENVSPEHYDIVISLAAEYGIASTLTIFRLLEYGKEIIKDGAITKINNYFH